MHIRTKLAGVNTYSALTSPGNPDQAGLMLLTV